MGLLHSRTRWQFKEINQVLYDRLIDHIGLPVPIARILIRRGFSSVDQIERFLYPKLDHLHSPFLLDGMKDAVNRIHRAIEMGEKIYIYGDYDVDGICSTSLLMKVFEKLNIQVQYYIPDRFAEGYGLNRQALQHMKDNGAQLVITVDTGISAVEEALFAKEIGIDLIITDHHEPSEKVPEAYAVINPKKENCSYPCKMLAGVGVAFKLATALMNQIPEELLDIVALGTIADLVPLVGENRVFAYYGLQKLNLRKNIGLKSLLEVSGITEEITESHVGFGIGPRINASGRLEKANQAVELLITKDSVIANQIAESLDQLNCERKRLVEEMTQEAIEQVEENRARNEHFVVVSKEDWHLGVIGIVASRLVEKYHLPVIVLSIDEKKGVAKGSARGIASFNLFTALSKCGDLLLRYGGHTMAAGMSLDVNRILDFHQRLSEISQETLTEEDLIPVTMLEDELHLDQVNEEFIGQIKQLSPFGTGNPVPYFVLRGLEVSRKQQLGEERNHLKLLVKKDRYTLDAIGFRFGELAHQMVPAVQVDITGELHVNEWNGRRSPQLLIRDISVPYLQIFDWRSNRNPSYTCEKIDPRQCQFVGSSGSLNARMVRENLRRDLFFWEGVNQEQFSLFSKPYIAFIDPPPSMQIFNDVLNLCIEAERLYFVFGDKAFDDVLVKVPSREAFKVVYVALAQRKRIHSINGMSELVRTTGLGKKSIQFILRVLQEVELISVENGYILCNTSLVKKEFVNSVTYREQLSKEKVLEILIHSSYQDLCDYLFKCTQFKWKSGADKLHELQR